MKYDENGNQDRIINIQNYQYVLCWEEDVCGDGYNMSSMKFHAMKCKDNVPRDY